MRFNFEVKRQLDFCRTDDGIGAWYSSPAASNNRPTNDELNIYLNEVNEYYIVLTDMLDNVVFTSKFQNNTFKLNCKNWANGIYFITISSNSNIYSSKFIKQ